MTAEDRLELWDRIAEWRAVANTYDNIPTTAALHSKIQALHRDAKRAVEEVIERIARKEVSR